MDSKTVSKLRTRIKKAKASFGAMGSMMLIMELQGKSQEELKTLRDALLDSKSPLQWDELDKLIK